MIDWIAATAQRLDDVVRPTVIETPVVSRRAGRRLVAAKQENVQRTGSFKIRGALAKLLSIPAEERSRRVIAASTGNHGLAVAHAASHLGTSATVYVTDTASPTKLAAIEAAGAQLETVDGDPLVAEHAARAAAAETGRTYVSPYNDRDVIAGQATVGVELVRQLEPPDHVVVSVGGGGLISGIAAVLSLNWPGVSIVGASPANSAAMVESVRAGHIVDVPTLPTLSDGTAGGLEAGSITFDLCRTLVDRWEVVTEEEIAAELDAYRSAYADPIEGSAAVALVAASRLQGDVLVVLCGGNATV